MSIKDVGVLIGALFNTLLEWVGAAFIFMLLAAMYLTVFAMLVRIAKMVWLW